MNIGYQRVDGLVYNGLHEGKAVWMNEKAFDLHHRCIIRNAEVLRARSRAALTCRHRERIAQERRARRVEALYRIDEEKGLERARRAAAVEALRVTRAENLQAERALRLREIGLL